MPESVLLKRERPSRYGSVPGLDDSELLSPDELERQVYRQEFEPILALPVKRGKNGIRPTVDEDGGFVFGAFGNVDFERRYPFNKTLYKADELRQQLKDLLILFSIVNDKIKTRAKYLVLKYLRMGIIELEHIENNDMRALARLYLRARRMRTEIAELWEASERRRQRKAETLWASV
ncbi:MAG: hypothetical protein H8E73_09750 [Planctomycetes bacterium]|nr:hypothetical protein [Planctomycetota bacterium]